ncbi:MAG: hypothetical protein HY318_09140 [Armatimonadetes bacterium]|nr:hypothetical protein [Armatimonadota bacterium]
MSEARVFIEEIDDPELASKLKVQDERFSQNLAVFQKHSRELFAQHRGKVIMVAGRELRVFDTADTAWSWARKVHPDDDGALIHRTPREKGWRVYADRR